ncbi:hypothetical protein VP1G_01691 [Cytospora mali]|uniref:ABM domain-containing protein n=1 Tax=Cytospora mali TaxID=578113 RepID=A0A194UR97_CYTMA|nr:hypothetical protein VP1G_01691 [Valsa mali var. pyri (nom. inval.)]
MATKEPYYSVSTLVVKPENVNKVIEFFTRVSKATEELEPAAEIYRWYKVEGKDEFVYIENLILPVMKGKLPQGQLCGLLYVEVFSSMLIEETWFRFASEEHYRAHQNSSHFQGLYKEYLQYITEPFVFYPIDTSKDKLVGGFERT